MDSKQSIGIEAEAIADIGSRLIEIAVAQGVTAGIRAMDEHLSKVKKSRYDRRLRNTRLLLKNYRSLKHHAQGAVYSTNQARENAIDILDGLDRDMLSGGLYVEGIKTSIQRTIVIINHINEMLIYYRICCEQSGKEEELRRYRTVMAMYINPERLTAQEIAERENVEVRTVYKDITAAIKPISALIFGIDSLKIE